MTRIVTMVHVTSILVVYCLLQVIQVYLAYTLTIGDT